MTPIPDSLASEDAAPMLCAGVTTYVQPQKGSHKGPHSVGEANISRSILGIQPCANLMQRAANGSL